MTDPRSAPPSPPRARTLLLVLVPVAALIGYGIYNHVQEDARAAEVQQQAVDYVPNVRVATAQRVDQPIDLILPGQTEAFDVASIYARATGYIADRRVDIGSRVKRGDLLVRIAAPDLDQQLAQAEAQLGQTEAALLQAAAAVQQAEANVKLANVTKFRETTLAQQGWETKQNADNSTANADVQKANVASARAGVKLAQANYQAQFATVQRLQALTAFERVQSPFDGVVTTRNIDTGDLVSADQNGGTPMFTVQRDDVLRIAVYVPQSGAVGMRDGLEADIEVAELPGRVFHGRVARSSVALAQNSRSLLTEVDVPNPDGTLRPGLYVNVTFHIPRERPGVTVPDEALVFNAHGMQVAVVDQDGVVHMRTVQINRDFGTTAELREGLDGGERVALSLPADVSDGGRVHVDDEQPQQGAPGSQRQARAS